MIRGFLSQQKAALSASGADLLYSARLYSSRGGDMSGPIDSNKPLEDLEHWEEFLKERYPEAEEAELVPVGAPEVQPDGKWKRNPKKFRDYRAEARPSVKE